MGYRASSEQSEYPNQVLDLVTAQKHRVDAVEPHGVATAASSTSPIPTPKVDEFHRAARTSR